IFARASSMAALLVRAGLSLVAISFAAFSFAESQILYQASAANLRAAGLELKRSTPNESLIVAAHNGDPTVLYYAERKGWHFLEKNGIYDGEPKDSAQAIVDLEELRNHGAGYLVFTSNTSWWVDYYAQFRQHLEATSSLVAATPEFKIYQLSPVSK